MPMECENLQCCSGHLDVLKYARANECPWSRETCIKAAAGGRLEVLQYAVANGCEWPVQRCLDLASSRPALKAWVSVERLVWAALDPLLCASV